MIRYCFLVLTLVLATTVGCKTTTIYNVHSAPLPTTRTATDDQIAEVIREAGRRQGWVIKPLAPGKMRGMYSKGRHTAVVAIRYTDSSFSIEYVESSHLRHDGDSIHKAYNKWVQQLEEAIQREAKFRLAS